MTDFNATMQKIKRLERLQSMQDNASYIQNWLLFQKTIHIEKMKIGVI